MSPFVGGIATTIVSGRLIAVRILFVQKISIAMQGSYIPQLKLNYKRCVIAKIGPSQYWANINFNDFLRNIIA